MGVVEAVTLGIVQGLTEFFPVSSSGHLVLLESLLGVNTPGVSFEVLVHLATVTAVIVMYRRRLAQLARDVTRGERGALRYVGKLALATIPAAIVGIGFASQVERAFDSPTLVAIALLFTGAVVYTTRWLTSLGERPEPGWGGSLFVGAAQALALVPGISRSGMTVVAALADKTERVAAAEFSFLLSIPAILGASVLELPDLFSASSTLGGSALVAAFTSAFAAAIVAIALFVRWLRNERFHYFAYYCWLVGAGYLAYEFIAS